MSLDPRRHGIITASAMDRVLGMSAAYTAELIAQRAGTVEIVTGEERGTVSTEWGRKWEPAAIAAYELRTGSTVERPGFLIHPEVEYVGGTPDGLVGADGGLEVKCPEDWGNHLITAASRLMPRQYVAQVQAYLWITGRAWWDFVSFDPRCTVEELVILRIQPDRALHTTMARRCAAVWENVIAGRVPALHDIPTPGNVPLFFAPKQPKGETDGR